MRIHELNHNINFSALRISKKNAKNNLSHLGKKTFNALDIVGEYLKDTKSYHLYIDKEIYIRHLNGEKMYPPYTVQQSGKILLIGYKTGFEQTRIKLPFDTLKAAEEAKANVSESTTQIERTAKIVKYLDDYEKKSSKTETNVIIEQTDSFEEKINKLINKYGV